MLHKLIVGRFLPIDPFPEAIVQSLKCLGNAWGLCGPCYAWTDYFNLALVRWVVDNFHNDFFGATWFRIWFLQVTNNNNVLTSNGGGSRVCRGSFYSSHHNILDVFKNLYVVCRNLNQRSSNLDICLPSRRQMDVDVPDGVKHGC